MIRIRMVWYGIILCISMRCHAWPFELDYSIASVAARHDNWAKARAELSTLLIDAPDKPDLLYDLGIASFHLGDFTNARAYFIEAAQRTTLQQNLQEQAWFNVGNSSVELNELEKAIKYYDQVLALNKSHEQALHNKKIVQDMLSKQQEQKKQDQPDKQQQQSDESSDQNNSDQSSQSSQSDKKNKSGQQKKSDNNQQKSSQKDPSSQERSDEANQNQEQQQSKNSTQPGQESRHDNREKQSSDKKQPEKNDEKQGSQNKKNNDEGEDEQEQQEQSENEQKRNEQQSSSNDAHNKNGEETKKQGKKDHNSNEQSSNKKEQFSNKNTQKNDKKQMAGRVAQTQKDAESIVNQQEGTQFEAHEQWMAQILENQESADTQASKKIIKTTIDKKMTGKRGQQCW